MISKCKSRRFPNQPTKKSQPRQDYPGGGILSEVQIFLQRDNTYDRSYLASCHKQVSIMFLNHWVHHLQNNTFYISCSASSKSAIQIMIKCPQHFSLWHQIYIISIKSMLTNHLLYIYVCVYKQGLGLSIILIRSFILSLSKLTYIFYNLKKKVVNFS